MLGLNHDNDSTADSPTGVLEVLRADKAEADAAEIRIFRGAVEWAVMHPVESILKAATVDGTEDELAIAGPGAPLVAEFCVAELALALGMSTGAGKRYLGDAVETRYRLPRLWKRVSLARFRSGRPARSRLARSSCPRTPRRSSTSTSRPIAHPCSYAQIDRAVDHARDLYDPDEAEAKRAEAAEHRNVNVRLGDVTIDGQVYIEATADLADALAFEAAISAKAHDLLEEFPHLSLDVRRSMALGTARHDGGGKELVIHAHHDVSNPHGLVYIENTRSWITVEQLGEWCTDSGNRVTIQPGAATSTSTCTPTRTNPRPGCANRPSRPTRPASSPTAPDHRDPATSTTSSTGRSVPPTA